ncbi:MAG TPA: PIG-L family deacetylase [Candidatus Limnocylindria bacterium]|nr:PIG-L family deacetylase [Candidatus Limnocylindria bacterium]
MAARRIVGVFAHPDDESLLAGGTLARYAAGGADCTVLTCTGGEAGDSWDPTVDPARIAEVRREELREACRRLGVQHVELLSYEDSGIPARGRPRSLAAAPVGTVADEIRRVLERHAPDAVITHDATGGYGHPDHIRVSEATRLAVEAMEHPPLLSFVVIPKRVVDDFQSAFASAGLRAGRAAAAGADMERDVGVPDEEVTATIDVSQHVRTKRSAVSAHRTQMTGHVLFRLPWPVLARLWSEEHFSQPRASARGAVARDLFADRGAV